VITRLLFGESLIRIEDAGKGERTFAVISFSEWIMATSITSSGLSQESSAAHGNPPWMRLRKSGYRAPDAARNHPCVLAALKDALDRSAPAMLQSHVPEELAGELARRLFLKSGARVTKAFFCSSGTEGVEAAIRTGPFLASHHLGIEPDLVALAKASPGGLVPSGAVLMAGEIDRPVFCEPVRQVRDELAGFGMVNKIRRLFEVFRRVPPAMFRQVTVVHLFRDHKNFLVLKAAAPLVATERLLDRFLKSMRRISEWTHAGAACWIEALRMAACVAGI
jgi:hypothetical protein